MAKNVEISSKILLGDEMTRIQKILLSICFFSLASFVLGVSFLFFINVPIEAFLVKHHVTQDMVDIILILIITLWFLVSLLLGFIYYQFYIERLYLHRKNRFVILVLAIISIFVFTTISQDDNMLLETFRGEISEVNKVSFGPYPDEKYLLQLKSDGYKGVVSLLNPIIPFEKVLLEREKKLGKKIGIEIYSFPMLPWVSDNSSSLEGIKQLINKPGSYYVHCYLGKHRANLVKKYTTDYLKEEEKAILPETFERGKIYQFDGGRVVLGPLPTHEEWSGFILLSDVTTIISYLDPDFSSSELENERQLCNQMKLIFKSYPLKNEQPDPEAIKNIVSEAYKSKGKVYIHGFKEDNLTTLLRVYLNQRK